MLRVAVVVVAGGTGTRFTASAAASAESPGSPGPSDAGSTDKLVARLGSGAVLTHLLDALVGRWPVVVVGPDRELAVGAHPVRTVREEPPGGGPLAGFAAGLDAVSSFDPPVDVVVLLGGDQPFAAAAVPRLVAAVTPDGVRSAVGVDADGRRQPLLSAHRRSAVVRLLAGLPDPSGHPLRILFRDAPDLGTVVEVPVDAVESLDVDVVADLRRARDLLPQRVPATPDERADGVPRT